MSMEIVIWETSDGVSSQHLVENEESLCGKALSGRKSVTSISINDYNRADACFNCIWTEVANEKSVPIGV